MHLTLRPVYFRPMLAIAAVAALAVMLAALVQPVSADPPGSNTTVKVDGEPFDRGPGDSGPGDPDNEPHITQCFAIDWYGFDEGEFYGTVEFRIWPPTGPRDLLDGVATQVLHAPSNGHAAFGDHDQHVYIGEDSAAGGGSEAGLDASIVYDLSAALSAYEPHHNQGWHVKITTRNDGVQGNEAIKHKVVWVEGPCAGEETTPPRTSTPTPTTPTTPTTPQSPAFTPTPTPAGGELGGTGTPRGGRIPDTSFGGVPAGQLGTILAGVLLGGSLLTLGADAIRRRRSQR